MNAAAFGLPAVDEALDRMPALAHRRRERVESLAGSDNRVYRLTLDARDYVIRFPGRARYIDVRAEFANQARAADAGVAPSPVALDETSGAIVSRWLGGDDDAATRRGNGTALAQCLARLHNGTAPFDDVIDPGNALRWNLAAPASADRRVADLVPVAEAALTRLPAGRLVNCHGDPTAGNIIGGGDRLPAPQLIDWEYSHRNNPAWDLAIHCNDAAYSEAAAAAWLAEYNETARAYGAAPVPGDELDALRGITALATAAWLINHAHDDDAVNAAVATAATWLEHGAGS